MNKANKKIEISIEKRRALLQKREKECQEILNRFRYDVPVKKRNFKSKTLYTHMSPIQKTSQPLSTAANSVLPLSKRKLQIIPEKTDKHYKRKTTTLTLVKPFSSPEKAKNVTYNEYLQLQTKAELTIRPSRGDMSHTLIDYIKKIKPIRKNVLEKDIEPILNAEDRYNVEIPEEDTKIKLEDKSLIEHLWKNFFTLQDYQNFFLDELKGKISKLNYRIMLKKFRQISKICFCHGTVNIGAIRYMLGEDY